MPQDKQNFLMFVTDNERTADKLCIVRKEEQQKSLTFSFSTGVVLRALTQYNKIFGKVVTGKEKKISICENDQKIIP